MSATILFRRMERKTSDERGATLIVVALLLVALMTIVALVIDLSFIRDNRQTGKADADFAATAGIRHLDNGSGAVQPWKGICAARDYLISNNPAFVGMFETYSGAGATANACTTIPATTCDNASPVFGTLVGVADGGRLRVEIKSGYALPDAEFPEDATYPSTDSGDGACDNLAVLITEREDRFFGGAVGSAGHETTIRSVGRLVQGTDGLATAALVLLERTACNALQIGGATTDGVWVRGFGESPGIIHSDSLGTDSCGSSSKVFDVNGSGTTQIRAGRAELPVGGELPGRITSVALSDAVGADPDHVSAPSPSQVCAQIEAADCTGTTGGGPTANDLVGRVVVDDRYRTAVISRYTESDTRFGWDFTTALASGFITVGTGPLADLPCSTTTFIQPKLFIDCGNNFSNSDRTFENTVQEVVFTQAISLSSSRVFRFDAPTKVHIDGDVSLSSSAQLRVNDNGAASCEARYASAPSARAEMVVRGDLNLSGGLLRLCQTTLIMTGCPVPVAGAAPYDNSCDGSVSSSGGSTVDWSGPNVNNVDFPSDAEFENLEDLAFWSEASDGHSLAGNGSLTMAGVFFTPNADPFAIAGNGMKNTHDAQFLTRRLEVAGNGLLEMRPDPINAVQIPVLGGFSLAR